MLFIGLNHFAKKYLSIVFVLMASVFYSLYAQTSCASMGWANLNGQDYVGPITGGGNATPIQVTSFSQLKELAESSGAKVIHVMNDVGNGYKGTSGDVINVASNKTIVGYKPGITVRCSWQIKNVSNVIVQNLICRGPGNSNSEQNWDCVNIQGSKRIWFDHCTVMEGEDGNFDVVKGSDNVSVTWCKFTYVTGGSHNLSNLIGSSNNEPQSHGKLNVTYAYCWWDNVNSRCPRTRYGKIHVLNCYYNNVGSGAYAGKMSNIRVEGSYFEDNVKNPTGLISTDGESGVFVIDCNRGSTKTDGYNTPFVPPYEYHKFSNQEVKDKITDANCGAGPTLDSPSDCGCSEEPIVDCNGVVAGGAYLDVCNVCVGGNTGVQDCSTPIQAPYYNTLHLIPGKIEAEAYDLGGEGLSYHEINLNGNEGGASFRNDEVDIETSQDSEGDYNVAYVLAGEWLAYTVNISEEGVYTVAFRVASKSENSTFHLEIAGQDVTGPITFSNTGGWQTWETVTVKDLFLSAGEQRVRVVFDSDYMNFNYMTFDNKLVTAIHSSLFKSELQVYPNPTANTVNWGLEQDFVLSDPQGQTQLEGRAEKVDLSGLAPGLYLLSIGGETVKVIKQD